MDMDAFLIWVKLKVVLISSFVMSIHNVKSIKFHHPPHPVQKEWQNIILTLPFTG